MKNILVEFHFGPYESNGLIRHKPKRLHGALKFLSSLGFEIELIPTPYFEILLVKVANVLVFRCNMKSLKYNMDLEDDIVSQRLVLSVIDFVIRYSKTRNVASFPYLPKVTKLEMQEIHKVKSFKDVLSSDVDLLFEVKADYVEVTHQEQTELLPPREDYNLYIDKLFELLGYKMAEPMQVEEEEEVRPRKIRSMLPIEIEEERKWPLLDLFNEVCASHNKAMNLLPEFRKSLSNIPRYKLLANNIQPPLVQVEESEDSPRPSDFKDTRSPTKPIKNDYDQKGDIIYDRLEDITDYLKSMEEDEEEEADV